jgi:futalosine hydrolase
MTCATLTVVARNCIDRVMKTNQAATNQAATNQAATNQNLILIPTSIEQNLAAVQLETLSNTVQAEIRLCGLGLVQAGVHATRLIHSLQPRRVWLLGIAGTYLDRLNLAEAYEFSQVACYGIGVGNGSSYRSPQQLGWSQSLLDGATDLIQLNDLLQNRLLISVAAASADQTEAELKLHSFPEAVAEDMESYAVAVACRAQGVPLRIVRGISNRAGERDHAQWKAAAAMQAAVELASELMKA